MGILASTGVGMTDQVKEAIEMYGHMITSMHKVNALRAENKASKDEEVRFHRLEVKVNALFAALPDADQRLIVDKLVIQGLMPAEVKDIIIIYEGRVNKC